MSEGHRILGDPALNNPQYLRTFGYLVRRISWNEPAIQFIVDQHLTQIRSLVKSLRDSSQEYIDECLIAILDYDSVYHTMILMEWCQDFGDIEIYEPKLYSHLYQVKDRYNLYMDLSGCSEDILVPYHLLDILWWSMNLANQIGLIAGDLRLYYLHDDVQFDYVLVQKDGAVCVKARKILELGMGYSSLLIDAVYPALLGGMDIGIRKEDIPDDENQVHKLLKSAFVS